MIPCAYNFQERALETVYDAAKFDSNPTGWAAEKEAEAIRGELQTIVPQPNCKPVLAN